LGGTVPTAGQRWRAAREAAGLSVAEAAGLAGVHRNTIYDLEKDDDGVTLRMMNRVAPIYGITLSEIFTDDAAPERVPMEFRPLLEPLLPLSQQAREAIIRNVASSLSFMRTLYGARVEAGDGERPSHVAKQQQPDDEPPPYVAQLVGAIKAPPSSESEHAPKTRRGSHQEKGRTTR
jgi:transcriptional regulator with XRE-family HTH domain